MREVGVPDLFFLARYFVQLQMSFVQDGHVGVAHVRIMIYLCNRQIEKSQSIQNS